MIDQATVSTPQDIQFCTFSDGSYREHYGGVGLAYKRHWLPREWVAGSADLSCGDMVEKAWSYGYAVGAQVMEGVGILESLYVANEETKRHLSVLEKHTSTVQVKVTTDCQTFLRAVSRTKNPPKRTESAMPPQLINQIREMVVTLQGHGVQVVVEMHWCPRNAVTQMAKADELAGKAMRSGLDYCARNAWSEATKSVIMKQLVPMLPGAVSFARSVPAADETEKQPKEGRRRKNKGKRKAEDAGLEEGKPSRPFKKARTQRPTMPASWGLDPETKVYAWDEKEEGFKATPVACAPFIRMVEESTMETGEKNIFVNDGASAFSMAKPT